MDICFVGQRDYRGFLNDHAPESFAPGSLVDTSGREVGQHDGIAGFTIGQRRGLGVAAGEPRFVVRIEPSTSQVVIGGIDDLMVTTADLVQATSTTGGVVEGRVMAQYRAHGEPVPGVVVGGTIEFDHPQRAIAPGQTVAFYDGERVLGGALIARTHS
jgi:tRNA-specific 2-thiouridylase